MKIVMDLTQDGLAMIFRDYQVLMLKYLWDFTDTIPATSRPEANTRKMWEEVNRQIPPKVAGRRAISRASVINTGKRFADEGIWDFREVPAKGGHHRIYHAKITEYEFWKAVKKIVNEKLAQV